MGYVLAILVVIAAVVLATSSVRHRLYLARLSRLRKAVSITISEYESGSWQVGTNLYLSGKLIGWMKLEEMAAFGIMVDMLIQERNPLLRVEMGDDTHGEHLKLLPVYQEVPN